MTTQRNLSGEGEIKIYYCDKKLSSLCSLRSCSNLIGGQGQTFFPDQNAQKVLKGTSWILINPQGLLFCMAKDRVRNANYIITIFHLPEFPIMSAIFR